MLTNGRSNYIMNNIIKIATGTVAGLYLARAVEFAVGKVVEAMTSNTTSTTTKKSAGRPKKTEK